MRNRKSRTFLTIGLSSVLAVSGVTVASAAEPVTVHFWHAMTGQLGETVDALVQQFNGSQDEFYVDAINRGSYAEVMTASIAAYRAHQAPQIVQVFEVGTQTMMMSGAVYPVYQLMEDYGYDIAWDRFVAPVRSYYEKDGNLYSMPFNSSTPILYYNKDAFRKAGLDPSHPPETWQEIEEFSRKIVESGAAEYGFSFGWPSWTMVENMHAWHGLPMTTNENGFAGLDTELLINGDFGVHHIAKLAEWQEEGLFRYGGRAGDPDPMFVNGQVAIYMQSSALIGGFNRSITDFEWGTGFLPHWGGDYPKVNSIIGGATLGVLNGSDTQENAGTAAFLKFLSEPEQQAFWHKATGYVALTLDAQALLEGEGYLDTHPNQRTAFEQLTHAPPTALTRGLRFGNFVEIRNVIEGELENIFGGEKTAQEGLDDAVRRSNQVLEDFASIYQ